MEESNWFKQFMGTWWLFLPNGIMGFFFALSIVIGSYQGVELIGITAGETKDPQRTLNVQ